MAIPQLALNVRRLHDLNLSGWTLVFVAIAVATCVALATNGAPALAIVAFALLLGFGLTLGIFSGDRGANRFGQKPVRR